MSDAWAGRQFEVEFTKEGETYQSTQVGAVANALEDTNITDVLVLSHGWNNNMTEARSLYDALTAALGDVAETPIFSTRARGRRCITVRVLWPSKKFDDADETPGGGASLNGSANKLKGLLQNLSNTVDNSAAEDLRHAAEEVGRLDGSSAVRERFLKALQSAWASESDETDEWASITSAFRSARASDLFEAFEAPVVNDGDMNASGPGGAAGLGGGGFLGAAERLLTFTTYWMMKRRAGRVGARGLHSVLRDLQANRANVRWHLIGHSFGGRLVTAAIQGREQGEPTTVDTLSLLQAAFSHNGFASKFDGIHDGYFRSIISNHAVRGPIIVTHTRNDKAVGVAYALASRLSRDNATNLGGPDDEFGGIGANGAVKTAEADNLVMLSADRVTPLALRRINNLLADKFVKNHSDIRGDAVASAIMSCLLA